MVWMMHLSLSAAEAGLADEAAVRDGVIGETSAAHLGLLLFVQVGVALAMLPLVYIAAIVAPLRALGSGSALATNAQALAGETQGAVHRIGGPAIFTA